MYLYQILIRSEKTLNLLLFPKINDLSDPTEQEITEINHFNFNKQAFGKFWSGFSPIPQQLDDFLESYGQTILDNSTEILSIFDQNQLWINNNRLGALLSVMDAVQTFISQPKIAYDSSLDAMDLDAPLPVATLPAVISPATRLRQRLERLYDAGYLFPLRLIVTDQNNKNDSPQKVAAEIRVFQQQIVRPGTITAHRLKVSLISNTILWLAF